ncbi:MAG: hypothetical protein F6K36_02975 [Symploca sp. SIO3C6]|nr:hypothetical protein [Symploca sp. SIO3C6]
MLSLTRAFGINNLRLKGRWGDGEMGRWGDGEMGRWGDGEMGRWGDGEMGREKASFYKKVESAI